MVRRLLHCDVCRRRFVVQSATTTTTTAAAASLCLRCQPHNDDVLPAVSTPLASTSSQRNNDQEQRRQDFSPSKRPRVEIQEIVLLIDDNIDGKSTPPNIDHGRIESEEDSSCSSEEDIPFAELLRSASAKTTTSPSLPSQTSPQTLSSPDNNETLGIAFPTMHTATITTKEAPSSTNDDLQVCTVCGSSLAHIGSWKGRMSHLKRCARQHGVTAQHMLEEDDKDLPNDENLAPLPALNARAAPKSVTQLLMAGARRKAIQEKHKAAAAAKPPPPRRGGWGSNQRKPAGNCPDFKKIPGTDFVVDGFYYAKPSLSSNYFLTHFHADHYGGLTKAWCAGIIYCSSVTATLVQQNLGIGRQYLHVLPMRQTMTLETRGGRKVKVTLIDANHCPGAVLMLFQVGEQSILHVGDFRWSRLQHLPAIHSLLQGRRLDQIYLDTTYCDPKYTLPTQQDAIAAAVEYAEAQVREARRTHRRLLLLFGAYTIGKERIYMAVAERLQMKVYVDRRRYRTLRALEWTKDQEAMLTTQPEESFLWVVPLAHISMKKLPSYTSVKVGKVEHHFDRVVGFRPTGWSLQATKSKTAKASTNNKLLSVCQRGDLTTCSVPYSEHSSFPELVDCLTCLQPRIIVPTVSVRKSQEQINLLVEHMQK